MISDRSYGNGGLIVASTYSLEKLVVTEKKKVSPEVGGIAGAEEVVGMETMSKKVKSPVMSAAI